MSDHIRPYDFTSGRQPCENFDPKIEYFGTNHHECFGPYDKEARATGLRCVALVSFCEQCTTDHHEGGWGACPIATIDRRPPTGVLG